MTPHPSSSRRALLLAALAVAALLAAVLAAFTPAYQQNDDVVMAMIASGRGLALQGDAHLVYVNVILGELLRRAYGWAPGWPWYGLLLLFAVALSLVALLHARLARAGAGAASPPGALRRWLVFLAYFAAVGSVFVVRLQFTAVAGLAAGAGLALWASGLGLLPALLLLLGALLRFQALWLALVIGLPLVADRLWRLGGRRALRQLAGLVAVLALAVLLHAADRACYERDAGWREFLELNAWRARIVDYGAGGGGPEVRALESRLGWSANDVVQLRRWFYSDRSVFPIEKLRSVVAADPVLRPGAAEAQSRLREAFSYPSLLPLALVLPLLVASGAPREQLRVLALTLVPVLVVVALLAVFLRAPEHVGLPALAFVPTALLVAGAERARPHGRGWWLALALAALGALLWLRQGRFDSVTAAEENRDLRRSVALLSQLPQRLYVDWAGAFRYEAALPLENASYLDGLRLYSLGWPQRSPIADRMLQTCGIDDLGRSLFERDDVGLLMNPAWRESLATYAREHYGAELRFSETARTPSFTVFRVERADRPAAAPGAGR